MAEIKIRGDVSGSTTIKAPDSGSDEVIELSTALAAKAPLASPTFTGTVALPSGTTLDGSALTSGKILQVVSASASSFTTSSGTFVDVTGVTVTITPSAASSKILVMVSTAGLGGTATTDVTTQLVRDSTAIANAAFFYSYPTAGNMSVPGAIVYVDSPNTTSATTYKLQARSSASNAIRIGGRYDGNFTGPTSIVAMEIGA